LIGPRGEILDSDDHVLKAYGLTPSQWVLIRPDGYVSAIAETANLSTIEAHLDAVGVTA
jgi:hypothetical protein